MSTADNSALIAAVFYGGKLSAEFKTALAASPDTIPTTPVGKSVRIKVCAFNDASRSLKLFLRFLRTLYPLFPSALELIAVFEDRDEGRVVFFPNPRNASGAGVVVTELSHERESSPNKHPPEIEITPAMIARGIAFLENSPLAMLTTMVSYPEFIESFLRETINGG